MILLLFTPYGHSQKWESPAKGVIEGKKSFLSTIYPLSKLPMQSREETMANRLKFRDNKNDSIVQVSVRRDGIVIRFEDSDGEVLATQFDEKESHVDGGPKVRRGGGVAAV